MRIVLQIHYKLSGTTEMPESIATGEQFWKGSSMRHTLVLFSTSLICLAAGALAQPAATNDSARKIEGTVNTWHSDPNFKQTAIAESAKSLGLLNGAIKSGGDTMES